MHLYAKHKASGESAHIHVSEGNISIWRNGRKTTGKDFSILGEFQEFTTTDRIDKTLALISDHYSKKEWYIQQNCAYGKSREEATEYQERQFQAAVERLKLHISTLREIINNYQPYESFTKVAYKVCFFICTSILILASVIFFSDRRAAENGNRYIKTGSRIVDTKTNQILLYQDGEWDWVELSKHSEESTPAKDTKKLQLRNLKQSPFSDSQYYYLSTWVTQKGASWEQIRKLLKKGYNYDMICYELETLE